MDLLIQESVPLDLPAWGLESERAKQIAHHLSGPPRSLPVTPRLAVYSHTNFNLTDATYRTRKTAPALSR